MAKQLLQKVITAAALVAVATVLNGCQTYDVKMSYKCTAAGTPVAPNTMCMEWEQVGGVTTPTTCFPGEATVITPTGSKSMSDLKIGDKILGVDHNSGKRVFSPVRAWLHRSVYEDAMMSAVSGQEGTLVASPRHNLATGSDSTLAYEFASELQEGSQLLRADGSSMAVRSVSETTARGLYAPLTATSNFFVGGPQLSTSVLAHSFAEFHNPRRYEGVLHRVMSVVEFFIPSIHDINEDTAYMHPVARVLMKLLPWMIENRQAGAKQQWI